MTRAELWRITWQGALLAPVVLVLALACAWVGYRAGWDRDPQWTEAWRHAHRPHMVIERWIRFRWIHFDSQYWIVPVRFDEGPVVLRGTPPDALYWSLTFYEWTEVHDSVSSSDVVLEPDGAYEITLSAEPGADNWIEVPPGTGKGVIYLRAYEPQLGWPVALPSVSQGGRVLVEGGLW